jgi:hypothetical protein
LRADETDGRRQGIRSDTKKGAADDVGAIGPLFKFDQNLAQACGLRQEVPKGAIALLEVSEDKGVLAFEVVIKGGFRDAALTLPGKTHRFVRS